MGGGSIVGGRYELVRKLAEGGMGAVWEARHTLSRKVVALKILGQETIRDETTRTRFLREVAAPAQIGHDGIVEVYDAGFDAALGSLFVAMELLQGETFRALLSREPIPQQRLVEIVLELLAALAAAHASGFVHRDLKPENVFLHHRKGGAEQVKILDFGIARNLDAETSVTQSGVAMGTPHYMSPEQASSARDVTPATDVWAVGVILYEGFAQTTPFRGDTLASLVVDVLTRPHRPLLEAAPQTPPAIAAVVDRCLDKDPKRRPAHGGELLAVLQHAAASAGYGPRVVAPAPLPLSPPTLGDGRPAGEPAHGPGPRPHSAIPTAPIVPATSYLPASPPSPVPTGPMTPMRSTLPSTPSLATQPGSATSPMPGAVPMPPVGSTPGEAPPQPERSWFWPGVIATVVFVLFVGVASVLGLGVLAYSYRTTTVRGTLTSTDPLLAGGQLYDAYDYTWSAGGRLQIFARSSAFATHVILHTPSGRQLDSSDSDAARIDVLLPESGTYRVIVTSRQPLQSGDYELRVDEP